MEHKGFQEYKSVFGFYADSIKANSLFSRANKLMKYARGYFIISRIIKYMSIVISFIETSAALIAISAILLVLIPVFFAAAAVFSLFYLIQYRNFSRELAPALNDSEKVMFIYSGSGWTSKKSAFLRGMARDFKKEGYTVFVVSRPVLKGGINPVVKEEEGLWIIKLNCYYIAKRKLLKDVDKSKLTYLS